MNAVTKPATEFARQQFKKLATAEAAFFSAETRPSLLTYHRENAREALCHLAAGNFITVAECHKRGRALDSPPSAPGLGLTRRARSA